MVKKIHRILWITDPWETLDHARDTTLRLMEEAQLAKLEQWWCDVRSIRLEGAHVLVDAKKVLKIDPTRTTEAFRFTAERAIKPSDFTSIHYRTDPPIDLAYLHPLQLLHLSLADSKSEKLINPSRILFSLNEKFEASTLGKLLPPSIVSSQWNHLVQFGKKEGKAVLKPLHDAQSHGIHLLDFSTTPGLKDAQHKIQEASQNYSVPVLLQRYLKAIETGETRLWFLDGRLLATVKKLPLPGDFRVNIDRGSRLAPTKLSLKQTQIARQIGKHLRAHQIRLAAVDLIENWVTDFNFSSPGLITLMEHTLNRNLARIIIEKLYPIEKEGK